MSVSLAAGQGTAKRIASAALIASRGGFTAEFWPLLAMSWRHFSLSGVREPKMTACPAAAQRVPRAAPTPPVPRMAIYIKGQKSEFRNQSRIAGLVRKAACIVVFLLRSRQAAAGPDTSSSDHTRTD